MRDGWIETTLGDVAEWWSGGTPKAREPKYYENGTIPWAVIADMNKGIINSTNSNITEDALDVIGGRLAPVGSVLISMYASVGKSAIANIPLATNQAIAWSIPNQEKIIPFYLYLVSQQLEKEISDLARGATQRNINRQMLREFTFQLPPLPEQKRIVDLISSVDSYIEALKHQLESTKKSRKAVLRELLTAGGIGWEESTLGDLISHSIGGIWGEEQGGAEVDVPVYRQTEFSDSGILTTPAEAIRSVSKSQLKNRTLQEGDILIQKSAGTPNLPGRVVSVPNLNGEVATFSNFLNLLRPNTDMCISRLAFLIFWDKHQDGRAFQYQRGTNIKNLDLPSYLLETILIPSAPDQKRIVELISTFDDFLAQTNHSISLFENLRSGLLSDLLSGEHEIPASYDKVMSAA